MKYLVLAAAAVSSQPPDPAFRVEPEYCSPATFCRRTAAMAVRTSAIGRHHRNSALTATICRLWRKPTVAPTSPIGGQHSTTGRLLTATERIKPDRKRSF